MLTDINTLFRTRDLIIAWTERTIRSRYQQSVLGGLWIVVQPFATVFIFSIIFTYFVPVDTGDVPYPIFSYVAVIAWTLLASSLNAMTGSLVSNINLVTKIYFPREVLPLSDMLARLLDFAVAGILLIIMMLVFGVQFNPLTWLALPVVLLIQMALILGLGLLFSASNVFYRDVGPLLALFIQLWFYASPVIYPVTTVPENVRSIYFLNPMAGILTAYRDILLNGKIPGAYLVPAAIISLAALILGYWFFKRVESQFADIV